ncbi:molybdopterin molybdotransferase MoeA [Acetobacter cibinongensis]|nr:molybdopterin molybdotransferase MoeA [Acetobacter cibinongensis]
MLAFPAAVQMIMEQAELFPLKIEKKALAQACHRTVAEDIYAEHDRPEADISAMDGYAFCHADMQTAAHGLPVVSKTVAGADPLPLQQGTAQAILTGARIPQGANCVMAGERMHYNSETGCVMPAQVLAEKGGNIRRVGEEFTRGTLLVHKGQILDWPYIAVLASQNIDSVKVVCPVRVALVANGGELSMHAQDKRADSNTPMLAAMLKIFGVTPKTYLAASDDQAHLMSVLEEAWQDTDCIVTTGGISVGDTDNVLDAFKALGAEPLFRGVKIRPGKPISVLKHGNKLAFCLPGNPGASALCAKIFLMPYLYAVMGADQPDLISGIADFSFEPLADTTHFIPVSRHKTSEGWCFTLLPTVGASDIRVLTQAVAFLEVSPQHPIRKGQICWAIPL